MATNEISGREVQKAVISDSASLISKFTLSLDLFKTSHKPSVQNCDGLLGLSSVGLSKKVRRRSPVCWYIMTLVLLVRKPSHGWTG